MCGVMGDVELFNYFTAYMTAAHQLAGIPLSANPFADYPAVRTMVQYTLFTTFSTQPTLLGEIELARAPDETPTEFTARVLRVLGASAAPL